MDVSGHLLLALLLLFSIVMVETAASHGNHGVVSQEELMKLAETEYNKAMEVRGNPVRISLCRALDPNFNLVSAGLFNLPIIFHVYNPALGSNSGMPWVFLAKGEVHQPASRWSSRRIELDTLNPVSIMTMKELEREDRLRGC
ncbi:hypothetical protein HPP92_023858 [Vanilla planifolia]|uniref:Uncharacterized protein n=1 Tax=Vanilla planifolia TaxID=51239 RepID=A0A835PMH0_VANPL|nr:hypothetical protein HPP92_027907 [Vanilla planifolia]KAG0448416.1 hypothetical protein HPP92_027859 [Vanilla planifolia]KAG0454921.1 hypothetical protein HPP92_024213 [Vanilla planifolia]KAG0456070.1 hypothetical protein HPP92_023858 [Vanilla planifolia]